MGKSSLPLTKPIKTKDPCQACDIGWDGSWGCDGPSVIEDHAVTPRLQVGLSVMQTLPCSRRPVDWMHFPTIQFIQTVPINSNYIQCSPLITLLVCQYLPDDKKKNGEITT